MSYSRWSNSRWYTFWSTFKKDPGRRSQIFDICGDACFTYGQLKDDIERCLNDIRDKNTNASDEEMEELKSYMNEFITDVESSDDINLYEDIMSGKKIDLVSIKDKINTHWLYSDAKDSINEALLILEANPKDLIMMLHDIKTELGKTVLERRLKEKGPCSSAV